MRKHRQIEIVASLLAAVLIGTAAAAQPAPPVPQAAAEGVRPQDAEFEYMLGPDDVIEIEVVGTGDRARVRISSDGTIQTSLGGRVAAAGRTPRQLATEVAKTLKDGGFYAAPVVNVEVTGYASRYVTVLGAVGSPGLVPINRAYRLSEILARVGGVRADAADYIIVRPGTGPEKRYAVDALAAGDGSQDPVVSPGDKIFSPAAEMFYISGQVKSPGSYAIKSDMTVAQAVAKAGGLTESGTDKKIKVRRGGKSITLKPEEVIQAGDVLTIRERLF